MSNERSNRTRKAEAIAAALVTVGCTAEKAASMDDMVWKLAARTGAALINEAEGTTSNWTDASPATRTEVIALLAADEAKASDELVAHETDDVFARIAAPHTGPQDQDAPIPTADTPPVMLTPSRPGAWDWADAAPVVRHPAASHTLNCWAGFNTTGCSC